MLACVIWPSRLPKGGSRSTIHCSPRSRGRGRAYRTGGVRNPPISKIACHLRVPSNYETGSDRNPNEMRVVARLSCF